jgi:hypothetical protein
MTATIPTPNLAGSSRSSRSSRDDDRGMPQLIVIDPAPRGGGARGDAGGADPRNARRPVAASAPSSRGLGILRAIVAAIGVLFVCVVAIILTFVWAFVRIVAHGIGRGRRADPSRRTSAAGPARSTSGTSSARDQQAPVV